MLLEPCGLETIQELLQVLLTLGMDLGLSIERRVRLVFEFLNKDILAYCLKGVLGFLSVDVLLQFYIVEDLGLEFVKVCRLGDVDLVGELCKKGIKSLVSL